MHQLAFPPPTRVQIAAANTFSKAFKEQVGDLVSKFKRSILQRTQPITWAVHVRCLVPARKCQHSRRRICPDCNKVNSSNHTLFLGANGEGYEEMRQGLYRPFYDVLANRSTEDINMVIFLGALRSQRTYPREASSTRQDSPSRTGSTLDQHWRE